MIKLTLFLSYKNYGDLLNPLRASVALNCQSITGFYMRATLALNGLKPLIFMKVT